MSDDPTSQPPAPKAEPHLPARQPEQAEKLHRTMGLLDRVAEDVKLLIDLLRDLLGGRYPHLPIRLLLGVVITIGYFIMPLDVIPELFLPVVGWLDDLTVTLLCVALAEKDLIDYQEWRLRQQAAADTDDD